MTIPDSPDSGANRFELAEAAASSIHSGYATSSSMNTAEWHAAYQMCRSFADRFEHFQQLWIDQDWHWPSNPLQQWSRLWEYPFALRAILTLPRGASVLDAGSGLTFFPWLLASLGYRVTMLDTDVSLGPKIQRVGEAIGVKPDFVNGSITEIPLRAGFDGIYCISVLEHLPHPASALAQLASILPLGSKLVLTFDVNCSPRGIQEAERLMGILLEYVRPCGKLCREFPPDALTVHRAYRSGHGELFFDKTAWSSRFRFWLGRIPNLAVMGFFGERK